MIRQDIFNALFQPVEWTPEIAARHLGLPVAVLLDDEVKPSLYIHRDDFGNYRRPDQPKPEKPPLQLWVQYPSIDEGAFIATCPKSPGMWSDADHHRVNTYGMVKTFDSGGTDYLMDQQEAGGAFVFVVGPPDFLQMVKSLGIQWVNP